MHLTFKNCKHRFCVPVALCTACIVAAGIMLTGCGKSYKEALMEKYSGYTKTSGYDYLCDWNIQTEPLLIGDKATAGATFELDEDCYLDTLTLFFSASPDNGRNVTLKIYKWNGNLDETLKAKPADVSTRSDYDDDGGKIFHFEEGKIGPGKYYYEIGSAKDNLAYVTFCAGAPESKGFYCGAETPNAPRAFITYNKFVSDGPSNPETQITPGKAHVIILTGQSNATGQAPVEDLRANKELSEVVSAAEKGFDNVKIRFAVDTGAKIQNEFTPVTLGQAADSGRFGPEVGLAYKLTQTYPDETFYILKYSCSGAGLSKHFQDRNGEWQYMSKGIKKALSDMKKDGLDPEVIAVLWMQGETDSWSYDETNCYAEKQEDFINRVKKLIDGYEAPNGFTFIDAAISESRAWTLSPIINAQKRICDAKDVNYVFMDTVAAGLISGVENDDIAHYGPHDETELGIMFADEIIKIMK